MGDALILRVMEQLSDLVQKESLLLMGVHEDVNKLSNSLKLIKWFLEDMEKMDKRNDAVKFWMGVMRDALYDAEDLIDKWATEMAVMQVQSDQDDDVVVNSRSRSASKVLSYCLSYPFKQLTLRQQFRHEIQDLTKRLDRLNETHKDLSANYSSPTPNLTTSIIFDVSRIYGLEEDQKIIVSRLLGESSHQEGGVQVVAIVGMVGIGKTTLARLVFQDKRVLETFEIRIWVCVTEHFDLVRIAKDIILQAGEDYWREGVLTEEEREATLRKAVKGKRFLLILDDVWTEDLDHWSRLKMSLASGAPGSRIIITTRNENVARMMGSHVHHLGRLSEDNSWYLLRDSALWGGRELESRKFEKVGREIAMKFKGGVPLELVVLGSFVCQKSELQNWMDVLENGWWGLARECFESYLLPAFFQSYIPLPADLKSCFLYFALFPKDTEVKKDDLIKLWMAEGFLGSGGIEEFEKVGEDHLNYLVMQFFFQDVKKDSYGKITSCKMHDLFHDFARYLSQSEFSNNRHFVWAMQSKQIENSSLYKAKKLQTLLHHKQFSVERFYKLSCLRVLDLHESDLEELAEAVERLIHLRYLDLSKTKLLELPETICSLYNLQTLRLNHCTRLHKLPKEIGRLSNLMHLEIERTDALSYLPRSVQRLRSLRTLSKFIVGGADYEWKISDLSLFRNLRGDLELKGLGPMIDENDAIHDDLKKKVLRCLTLDCEVLEKGNDLAMRMGNLFERLEPHEDLEELNVRNYPGFQFPSWFSLSRCIVKMRIENCEQCTQMPALGKLVSLEILNIDGMGSVKCIGHEFYGFDGASSSCAEMIAFPKLKKLILKSMDVLESWELPISKGTKIMPLLCELVLFACPKLRALPGLGKLESLETLDIYKLPLVEELGHEFLGISNDDGSDNQLAKDQKIFPKLMNLGIGEMVKLKQWSIPFVKYGINIMPCLCHLRIEHCPRFRASLDFTKFRSLISLNLLNLYDWTGPEEYGVVTNEEKSMGKDHFIPSSFSELRVSGCPLLTEVPSCLFSPTLKNLVIEQCPELSGVQRLPLSLESVQLIKNNGGYSKSLQVENECSIRHVILNHHRYSLLPQGFQKLKALQILELKYCDNLDFEFKELKNFSMLQELNIVHCRLLKERFEGGGWRSILAHDINITINNKEITKGS